MDQSTKAATLRRLHLEPQILVLPNAWDVASAKGLAAIPGCRALATTSAAVARSLGWEDGEQAPVEEMLRMNERIAAAVDLPVTGDLEHGYGDPVGTARHAWGAGLVGINFEDSTDEGHVPLAEQVEMIRAIREAVPELVINARVDVFVRQTGGIEEAVERGNAYLDAGADCVYPILCPVTAVADLAGRIDGPINVLAIPGMPEPHELQNLGVARMTWGSGLATLAYEKAVRVAAAALNP
ncbi:MAG TPA: isocitrate lyase/phosphoenolpyruvate mutase family protein [Gaiellaceae bacterium]|jgi:2-methylisocitrate lyase-like PEP mutase family enzyme|nr:isocitrate lyase/phosphoenolpyruvate mutase family protein [Gaiellaceae bacterium]